MAQTMADWTRQLLKTHEFTSNGAVLPESISHLQGLLAKNHRYSMIHGEYRTNHMVHHLYSLLVLGAPPARLDEVYTFTHGYLEPMPPSAEAITDENWEAHIGNHATYPDYLDYFDHKVTTLGLETTFQRYFPRLIPGLTAAVGHPLIHTGYAMEFRHPQVLAEALAYACSWYQDPGDLFDPPADLLLHNRYSDPLDIFTVLENDSSLTTDLYQYGTIHKRLHRLLESPENTKAKALVNAWDIGTTEAARLNSVRRLMRAITFEYAAQRHVDQLDFFIVHAVTSMFATQTLVPLLQPSDQDRLLRVQLYYALLVYLAQGRETFSQEVLDKYELPARFQALDQAHLDQAVHREAIGNGDVHAVKAVRALQAFTKLDPEFRASYTKAAIMTLDRVKDRWDWRYLHND
ncbi:hypothetical protein H4R34_004540 [Dimargaris verticillata]|uniref:DUF4243 domain-containing protein n=1 Tax=Dimargaris verticillata TaxID=2761393 RepID=A0A9W8AY36_9FUNG|nr:hypothetical protein H4R34_004540 [Dimargaris verticillata]